MSKTKTQRQFDIVFEKLNEHLADDAGQHEQSFHVTLAELDEIANLRQIVLEITEPQPQFVTTT